MKKFKLIAGIVLLAVVVTVVLTIFPPGSWFSAPDPAESAEPSPSTSQSPSPSPEPTGELPPEPTPLVSLDDEALAEYYHSYVYNDSDETKRQAASEGDFTKALKAAVDSNPENLNKALFEVYGSNEEMRRYVTANASEVLKQDLSVDEKVIPHLAKKVQLTKDYRDWFGQQEAAFRQSADGKLIPQGVKYQLNGMGFINKAGELRFNPFDPNKAYEAIEVVLEFIDKGIFMRMVFVTECGNPAVPYNPPKVENPPKSTSTPTPEPTAPPQATEKPKEIPVIAKKVVTGDRGYPYDAKFPISVYWQYASRWYYTPNEFYLKPDEQKIIGYVTDPKLFNKDSVGIDERLTQELKNAGWSKDGFKVVVYTDAIYIYVYNAWYYRGGGGGGDPTPTPSNNPKSNNPADYVYPDNEIPEVVTKPADNHPDEITTGNNDSDDARQDNPQANDDIGNSTRYDDIGSESGNNATGNTSGNTANDMEGGDKPAPESQAPSTPSTGTADVGAI